MTKPNLNFLHIAVLLVSASYGIGFLFGSGELALRLGMAGSIYAIATAVGMIFLAYFSRRLWSSGLPIWDVFGQAYGRGIKNAVALLSIVWMSGVLAAQIHGSTAILKLIGVPTGFSYLFTVALLLGTCSLSLQLASKIFSLCLIGSNLILFYVLFKVDGLHFYWQAIPNFIQDTQLARPYELFITMTAIVFLVITGADYQQFVIAARRPFDAIVGCALAAAFLLLTGFLPAAAVLAAQHAGALGELSDAKQVIPFMLAQFAGSNGSATSIAVLLVMLSAALGSGAAIIRAMTAALASTIPAKRTMPRPLLMFFAAMLGTLIAARGQSIIDTMVAVNIVYIGSTAVLYFALQKGLFMMPQSAKIVLGVGFASSFGFYIVGWLGYFVDYVELFSLVSGLSASASALILVAMNRPQRVN